MTLVHRTWRLALVLGVVLAAGAFAPVLAQDADVSIVDRSFDPATITIEAGNTVTWTTTKAIGEPHSVTSGKPGDADAGSLFDSGIGLQENGQSFAFRFDTPGTYDYYCQVHPTVMTGQVVVTAAGGSAPPASEVPPPSQVPPASQPATSGQPAGSPGASVAPTAPPISPEAGEPFPPENRLIAGGVLVVALVLLFAASWYWRRLNPG